MELIVVRHAIAEDRVAFARTGHPDELRPLTAKGRERMRRAAAGLRTLVPSLDLLATSPLTRAVQTAEILCESYRVEAVEIDELAPEADPEDLLRWLDDQPPGATVMVVGHEPSLGLHVSWLTASARAGFVDFRKGGACLLRFEDRIGPGRARMLWLLTPRQLRRLGD